MNAAAAARLPHAPLRATPPQPAAAAFPSPPAALMLLGTGTVGSAVLARLADWRARGFAPQLRLLRVQNSRAGFALDDAHIDAKAAQTDVRPASPPSLTALAADARWQKHAPLGLADIADALHRDAMRLADAQRGARIGAHAARTPVARTTTSHIPRILIDATASDAVAAQHAAWLAQGIHVVTACKLGQGTSLARWQAIAEAQSRSGAHYGDAATVGAGLPLLRTLRALRDGGDRIHAVAGVLSGSLAWLLHAFDGLRPFSGFVREAAAAGYTEPDPREDLSGEDVRRKLLILARAAGIPLAQDSVQVESLVPPALAALPAHAVDAALPALDAPLRARYADAYKRGERLRFIARLDCDVASGGANPSARVGLEALPVDHPLAAGGGSDNRVAIWSDRYRERPLVIQGPGAGAEVTAAGVLDDVLGIVRDLSSR